MKMNQLFEEVLKESNIPDGFSEFNFGRSKTGYSYKGYKIISHERKGSSWEVWSKDFNSFLFAARTLDDAKFHIDMQSSNFNDHISDEDYYPTTEILRKGRKPDYRYG